MGGPGEGSRIGLGVLWSALRGTRPVLSQGPRPSQFQAILDMPTTVERGYYHLVVHNGPPPMERRVTITNGALQPEGDRLAGTFRTVEGRFGLGDGTFDFEYKYRMEYLDHSDIGAHQFANGHLPYGTSTSRSIKIWRLNEDNSRGRIERDEQLYQDPFEGIGLHLKFDNVEAKLVASRPVAIPTPVTLAVKVEETRVRDDLEGKDFSVFLRQRTVSGALGRPVLMATTDGVKGIAYEVKLRERTYVNTVVKVHRSDVSDPDANMHQWAHYEVEIVEKDGAGKETQRMKKTFLAQNETVLTLGDRLSGQAMVEFVIAERTGTG